MPRTVDIELRQSILKSCVDAALKAGIRKVSLAELSKITGVSRRMLIYHFGTVEKLVEETLSGAQERIRSEFHRILVQKNSLDSRQVILTLWSQSISGRMEPSIRAYFQLYLEAIENRDRYKGFIEFTVPGWISWTQKELEGLKPEITATELTLILSILRGLHLDYWATRDRNRTTRALETFLRDYPFGKTNPATRRTKNLETPNYAN